MPLSEADTCRRYVLPKLYAAGWTDESTWPQKRDISMFMKWFDVEFHSAVLDLIDAPLEDDE